MNNYRAFGKEIKRDGEHIADAADPTWAQIIADALNGERGTITQYQPTDDYIDENGAVVTVRLETHIVTNHVDGSRSCICGRRWDRDEGDICPGEQHDQT